MPKRTRNYDSWLLKELTDAVVAANYINAATEDSEEMLLVAMRNVAEAHKMSRVAQEANVNRESLYKTLSSDGNPLLATYKNILNVFGLKIQVVPKDALLVEGRSKQEANSAQVTYAKGGDFIGTTPTFTTTFTAARTVAATGTSTYDIFYAGTTCIPAEPMNVPGVLIVQANQEEKTLTIGGR